MYSITNKGDTLRYVADKPIRPGETVQFDPAMEGRINNKAVKFWVESGELEVKKTKKTAETKPNEAEIAAQQQAEEAARRRVEEEAEAQRQREAEEAAKQAEAEKAKAARKQQ